MTRKQQYGERKGSAHGGGGGGHGVMARACMAASGTWLEHDCFSLIFIDDGTHNGRNKKCSQSNQEELHQEAR